MKDAVVIVLAVVLSGCSAQVFNMKLDQGQSLEVAASERRAFESQTLVSLAALERSINDYVQSRRQIPKKLDELVSDFLAEIPTVELGIKGYKPTAKVAYYPASVIVDKQINGAALDDTGGWGYTFNDRQVIVFVDCTRKRMNGTLWYQARGVY
ncbi:MAG: hypothetical protein COB53_03940 [Elusimicrobia bacterium]|nr:MAG: hypothetical protein COB53_03940 [Elusimicrobiota bacterium]